MTDRDEAATMAAVTHLAPRTTASGYRAEAAVEAADAVARAAGVTIRELRDFADFDAAYRLYDDIWHPDPQNPPITTELLTAMAKTGSYVTGAFDDGLLVGACAGFFAAPADGALHSHIAGVSAAAGGHNVGFALKTHQRAWALRRGLSTISWTFDPLVRRNAYFNLVKLAAFAVEYLPNFYGGMHDGINGGDATDRLLTRWDLTAPPVVAACAGTSWAADAEQLRAGGAVTGLGVSPEGAPVTGTLDAPTVLVAIPADIERLRRGDARLAGQWRVAVREVLGTLLANGSRITGFDRAGWYVVTASVGPATGSR